MPELSHDASEDGFHEIQLSGKQLVFLFMAGTIVSVFIFLCGVLVGRGARDAAAGPTDTVAAAEPADGLSTEAGARPLDPPAPAETDLTYHDNLLRDKPPAQDEPKRQPEAPRPAQAATPPPVIPAPAVEPARSNPEPDVPTTGRPGALLVQVLAVQDRSVAAALVRRLSGKGYPAYLVAPASRSAPQIYKVQVGRFNDRREAEEVKRRLEKEEQFKPWITSSR